MTTPNDVTATLREAEDAVSEILTDLGEQRTLHEAVAAVARLHVSHNVDSDGDDWEDDDSLVANIWLIGCHINTLTAELGKARAELAVITTQVMNAQPPGVMWGTLETTPAEWVAMLAQQFGTADRRARRYYQEAIASRRTTNPTGK